MKNLLSSILRGKREFKPNSLFSKEKAPKRFKGRFFSKQQVNDMSTIDPQNPTNNLELVERKTNQKPLRIGDAKRTNINILKKVKTEITNPYRIEQGGKRYLVNDKMRLIQKRMNELIRIAENKNNQYSSTKQNSATKSIARLNQWLYNEGIYTIDGNNKTININASKEKVNSITNELAKILGITVDNSCERQGRTLEVTLFSDQIQKSTLYQNVMDKLPDGFKLNSIEDIHELKAIADVDFTSDKIFSRMVDYLLELSGLSWDYFLECGII